MPLYWVQLYAVEPVFGVIVEAFQRRTEPNALCGICQSKTTSRMDTPQGNRGRATCLPEMQISLLEQTPSGKVIEGYNQASLAERKGVEPSGACTPAVLQTAAIDHSATSPLWAGRGDRIFPDSSSRSVARLGVALGCRHHNGRTVEGHLFSHWSALPVRSHQPLPVFRQSYPVLPTAMRKRAATNVGCG